MVTGHIQNMKLRHKPNMPLQPGNLSNTSLDQETSVNSGVRHQPVHFKEIYCHSIEMKDLMMKITFQYSTQELDTTNHTLKIDKANRILGFEYA